MTKKKIQRVIPVELQQEFLAGHISRPACNLFGTLKMVYGNAPWPRHKIKTKAIAQMHDFTTARVCTLLKELQALGFVLK